ncbi:MAG TPA: endonuclease MutS2 [Dehalococcoidia bacterium]|nr:endonuclease MutS2 [Dehalococcoidia bacterium]
MDEHALRTLEYDKVLARLAARTAFSAGRELALALQPSTDVREVVQRQRETAEARRLLELAPRTGMGGCHDVRPQAEKAARGGVLLPDELLNIATTLERARELKSSISRLSEELPLLAESVEAIEPQPRIIEDINRSINQRAEVTDQASPALGAIRREVRALHDRLYQRMQEILANALSKGIAQEPIITIRDGRYVIPVKADMRGQMKGIVHDVSGTGATVWLEPLTVVDQANRWREAQLEEEREVERVLRALSAAIGAAAEAIVIGVEVLAHLDVALAKAAFADEIGAHELPYAGEEQPWVVEAPAQLHLLNARHPLLKPPVVPVTVTVGGTYRVLLITGPNTGGKTVALKTAGLLSLMAQAGLPVPADRGSRIPVFDSIFADIGDEQSIEQSLSTFSSHMTNIIRIVSAAGPKSLVLLDELAAGTDPTEGSALARAVLNRLLATGALTVATTHHGELKAFAHDTEGVMNASVEFDVETLSPTYHLSIGLPGRSNALEIAQRLGMPAEIIADARSSIGAGQLQVESLLSDIRREREEAATARRSEEVARREAEEIRERLEEKLDRIDEERERVLEQARRQVDEEVRRARTLIAETEKEVERQRLAAAQKKLQEASEEAKRLAERFEQRKRPRRERRPRRAETVPAGPPPEEIEAGDLVWLRGMDRWGEAVGPPDDRGEVEVRLGPLRSRIRLAQVEKVQRPSPSEAHGPVRIDVTPPRAVPPEIEVRGQTVDEAMPTVDRYLDEAFRAGLPWARIVHGKGTGTLRREVRTMLAKHPLVKSYEEARPEEGGEGVTIAHLAT